MNRVLKNMIRAQIRGQMLHQSTPPDHEPPDYQQLILFFF
jgi:hypothetical protein